MAAVTRHVRPDCRNSEHKVAVSTRNVQHGMSLGQISPGQYVGMQVASQFASQPILEIDPMLEMFQHAHRSVLVRDRAIARTRFLSQHIPP